MELMLIDVTRRHLHLWRVVLHSFQVQPELLLERHASMVAPVPLPAQVTSSMALDLVSALSGCGSQRDSWPRQRAAQRRGLGPARDKLHGPGGQAPVGRGDGTAGHSQYGGQRTSDGPRPASPASVCAVGRSAASGQLLCDTGARGPDPRREQACAVGRGPGGQLTPRPVNRSRGLMPSERMAVSQISSGGVSNTRLGSALV